MKKFLAVMIFILLLQGCGDQSSDTDYFDNSGRTDVLSGGVRLIPIDTPKGVFHVWTKRVGNNPTMKVLLLHAGRSVQQNKRRLRFSAGRTPQPATGQWAADGKHQAGDRGPG